MASGSSLMPPSDPVHPAAPQHNGHISPVRLDAIPSRIAPSDNGGGLPETEEPIGAPSTAQPVKEADENQGNGVEDEDISDAQDEDAEGEEDADYSMEYAAPPQNERDVQGASSPSDSDSSLKRKASLDDNELIAQNPELYGLRRSGRARPSRRVVDSSDDDASDADAARGPARKRRRTASEHVSKQPTPASLSSDSDSESDVYVGARRNALTKKQKRHQLQVAAGLAPPSQSEIRFSTRRANKVTNYNVDDDDDDDEEEMAITPNYYAGLEEDVPGIDVVLNHDMLDDKIMDPDLTKSDFKYLIKWQDKAHFHATWETTESLAGYKGLKRLDNYFNKFIQPFIHMSTDPDVSPEDREQWFMDREKKLESDDEHQQVERVIDTRETAEDTEYLIKWKGVEYRDSTWESASLVEQIPNLQDEIDAYLNRSSKLPISDKSQSNLKTRRPWAPFKEQPSYIKFGELREFQIRGVNFIAHHWCQGNNVILADEMGLGKTVQTVSFLNWLRHDRGQQGPFLVVVPLTTIPAWADTLKNWTPDVNYVVYLGKAPSREIIRDKEITVDGNAKKPKCHVVITSYEYILSDCSFLSAIPWQFLIVDEAHRLKNRDSQLYAKLMDFNIPNRLLITGTPLQNTLTELSALMDFLMPGRLNIDEDIDLQSEDASQKIRELTDAIKPYMIRRMKQKVENDLPPKTEKIIRVELSDVQLEYYKNILTRNYSALNAGARGPKQSLLNIMMELKKASNHPFMFPQAEERILGSDYRREEVLKALITSSGKMMLLDRLLTKLRADGHRVLIFSQMVKMLDILSDYLQLRGYQYQRIDGTIASGPRRIAIDHFNAPDSDDYCFLLSTRAGGLGINLMTADTVILFDSDWNPQADLQAMARAHRIGQKKPVTIYRLLSKDTVEEEILERARNKLMLEYITIQRGVTDQDSKLFAMDKDFSQKVARANKVLAEPSTSDDISRILKKRGQKMFEQVGNQKKLEELDIDAVLADAEEHKTEQPEGITTDGGEDFLRSFEFTDVKIDVEWDDIIPKDQLEAIKAEEKKREEEAALAAIIEQNQPRKRKAAAQHEEREQRAAKKRARMAAAELADPDASDEESGSELDPKRPLNEKEVRNLIRAHERYGSFDEKADEMVKDAKLVTRDRDLLKATIDDVIAISHRLIGEEQDRVDQKQRQQGKVLTKKDKKAVLFDYKGVKRINAETITERPMEMRMIRDVVASAPDWRYYRVPEATKPAHYTCDWGAREDGMLCVGVARHGFGAWPQIRDDAELGLGDKFYLEEHRVEKKQERKEAEGTNIKSPGAVHLVRRANYLLSVLKDKTSNGTNPGARRALENHHRNNKKMQRLNGRPDVSSSVSASPAPTSAKVKIRREMEKARSQAQSSEHRRPEHRHSDSRSFEHRRTEHRSEHRDRNSSERRLTAPERNGTPDMRRQHSGDRDERPYKVKDGSSAPHSSHHRHDSNGSNTPRPQTSGKSQASEDRNQQMDLLFTSIQPNLKQLHAAATGKLEKDANQAKVLRTELINVGNFIETQCRENGGSGLQPLLWSHVIQHYWPKKIQPDQLRGMYKKLLDASKAAEKQAGKPPAEANGEPATAKA